jgi:hypothetical protein
MNNCKFQKLQYQVSYDSGSTWQPVVPQRTKGGALIEYDSQDCTAIGTMYRWRVLDGEYICDGHSKYVKEIRDESYNGGTTWYTSYPTVYRTGQYVGEDAEYCKEDKFVGHYIPGEEDPVHSCKKYYMWNGFSCVYVDPIKVVKCPDYPYTESYITTGITQYYTSGYTLSHCTIGDCVTGIGDRAFFEQTAMTRINSDVEGEAIIPSGVTSIGESAFLHCNGLRTIDLPSGITSIGASAFTDDYMVRSVYLRAPLPPKLGESAFTNVTFANACGIYVPCITAYLHSYNWRNYRDRLHILPDSQGCEFKLFSSHWNSSSAIATNDFSVSCNDSSVLSSGETYLDQNRYETTDVVIGNCVTEIGDSAFSMINAPSLYDYGGWLSSVTISDSVTEIGDDAFHSCKRLSAITIPDSVTTIGNSAFQKCIDLGINTTIDIPSGVTTISDSLFKNCYNSACTRGLSAVRISPNVTSIGNSAFYDCKALRRISLYGEADQTSYSVYIPTACTTIGELAFYNTDPYIFNIPSSVTTIGNSAFEGCSGSSFVFTATVPPVLGTNVFKNACLPDGVHNPPAIYVPCESYDAYINAPGWSDYADKIKVSGTCTVYRWYPWGYICIDDDKYNNNIRQVSTDGGWVWNMATPTQYSASTLVEEGASICINGAKWKAVYDNGHSPNTKYFLNDKECDGTTELGYEIPSYENISAGTIVSVAPSSSNDVEKYYLRNVEIGDCVTSIADGAFSATGYTYISDIIIPDTVTSIGNEAFDGCGHLTGITIPDSVTSMGYGVFNNCANLTSVSIGSGLTSISDSTFYGCSSLTSVTIPDTIRIIGGHAFRGCSSLTSVTIPSGVTSIGTFAFIDCSSLTSVTIEAETPPTIGLQILFNTNDCPIYVPCVSVDTYKETAGWSDYASRIQGIPPCDKLYRWWQAPASDYICDGTSKYYKEYYQESDDGGETWENVVPERTRKGDLIETQSTDCGYVPTIFKWNAIYTGGTSSSAQCSVVSSAITSGDVTTTDLMSVEIGNCVTSIGDSAFTNADTLSSVTINRGTRTIGKYAFAYCSGLTSIEIPNSVTSIGNYTFYECKSLTGITLPNSITSIGAGAFYDCYGLMDINIPSGVTAISSYTFNGCTNLPRIVIPSGVTSIGGAAFRYCDYLTSVTISDTVTSIGQSAFYSCQRLTGVTLPDIVTSIGGSAFQGCSSLTSIDIPSGVTSINRYIFDSCTNLTSVTMGSGVTSIDVGAFRNCTGLASITIETPAPPTLGNNVFYNCYSLTAIYVPAASVETYKSASGWSTYASIIQAIP